MKKQQKIKHWQDIFEQQKSSAVIIIQFFVLERFSLCVMLVKYQTIASSPNDL